MSGLSNQLMIAEESTFGTYVPGTRGVEFIDDSMALDFPDMPAQGQRPGDEVVRSDHVSLGRRQAAGGFSMEVPNKGFGVLLKHALGSIATAASGAGKKHTATLGTQAGKSLSLQFGRSDIADTVQPFSYTGSKILGLELSCEVESFLTAAFDVDSQNEDTAQALVAMVAPALTELFDWNRWVVTVAGSTVDAISSKFHVRTPMRTDRFYSSAQLKKEQRRNGKRDVGGEIVADFGPALTAYNRFITKTPVAITMQWTTVLTYDVGLNFKLLATMPACLFTGTTPNSNGQEDITQPLPFKVLYDGVNAPITIDYFTSDVLP